MINQNPTLKNLFQLLQNNKNLLISNSFSSELLAFLKDWFQFTENEVKKSEQNYIWDLMHGWSLTDWASEKLISPEEPKIHVEEEDQKVIYKWTAEKLAQNEAKIEFISCKEAVISANDTFIWINPTDAGNELLQIQNNYSNIIIVLVSSHFSHLFSLLDLVNLSVNMKIITLEPIYKKLSLLINYLQLHEPEKYSKIQIGTTYFLKTEQYFEYSGFLWLPSSCCWYEPTYDLIVTPNRNKSSHYLIQSQKLTQVKFIYYGWKKGYISEQNYQKYTENKQQQFIKAKKGVTCIATGVKMPDPKQHRYLTFIQKDFISELEYQDQEELWACCQQLSFTTGQIIVKKGMIFDHIYLLFEGEYQLQGSQGEQKRVDKNIIYGLEELKNGQTRYSFTLRSTSPGIVARIERQSFKFLLYDYLR